MNYYILLQDTFNLIWLGIGLLLAGILEAFIWKTSFFEIFNKPIQTELFGQNKKWRGLISLPIASILVVFLLQIVEKYLVFFPNDFILFSNFNFLEYGLLVGFIFNLSELPNSFIKRRLDIPPGDESSKLFFFIDHMDSTYGVLVLWYLYFKFPLHIIAIAIFVTPLLFMGATWLRKKLGLK